MLYVIYLFVILLFYPPQSFNYFVILLYSLFPYGSQRQRHCAINDTARKHEIKTNNVFEICSSAAKNLSAGT